LKTTVQEMFHQPTHIFKFVFLLLVYIFCGSFAFSQKIEWLDAAKVSGYNGDFANPSRNVLHIKNKNLVYFTAGLEPNFYFQHQLFNLQNHGYSFPGFCAQYDTSGAFNYSTILDSLDGSMDDGKAAENTGQNLYYWQVGSNYKDSDNNLIYQYKNGKRKWEKTIIKSFPGTLKVDYMQTDISGNALIMLETDSAFTVDGKKILYDSFASHSHSGYNKSITIVKLDSIGSLIWVKPVLFFNNSNGACRFSLDSFGDIYYYGNCNFNGGTANYFFKNFGNSRQYYPKSSVSSFFGKLGNSGNFKWFHFYDVDINALSLKLSILPPVTIDVDKIGNQYFSGALRGKLDLGSGIELDGGINYSPFIIRFDSSGRPVWSHVMPVTHTNAPQILYYGFNNYAGFPVSLDGEGNVYNAGVFSGDMFTGKDTVNAEYSSKHDSDFAVFINKFDTSGKVLWTHILKYNHSGAKYDRAPISISSISADKGGLYFTATYIGSIFIDTFYNYSQESAFMNGKMAFIPVFPDSFNYTHFSCSDSPYNFRIYYSMDYTTIPDSVLWDFGDGTQSLLYRPSHSYAQKGFYTVNLTTYVLGHAKTFTRIINYLEFPPPLPADTVLCQGTILHINDSIPGPNRYLWNDGDTMSKRNISKQGFYKLTVTASGCTKSDSFNLLYDIRSFSLGNDTTLCQVNLLSLNGPSWPNSHYKWNTGSATQSIVINSPGTYNLYVNDGFCNFSDSINVKYNSPPSYHIPSDTVICPSKPIKFEIHDFSGTIQWQDGKTDSDYTINTAGTYTLALKNLCGTKVYTSVITDSNCECNLFVPNAFTPNNDHINDILYAVSSCEPITYTLQIYNRWGERLFQSNDINVGWDGTYKKISCAEGVYVYKILYKFQHSIDQIRSGTIVVGR